MKTTQQADPAEKKPGEVSYGNHSYLHDFPQWFLGLSGLVYISGYLIVSLQLGRLGITEAGGDFLKLRFIAVGMLYIMPYLVIVLPVLAMIHAGRVRNAQVDSDETISPEEKKRIKLTLKIKIILTSSTMILYLLFFTAILYFAPHGFIKEETWLVMALSVVPIVGLAVVIKADKKITEDKPYLYVMRAIPATATLCIGAYLLSRAQIWKNLQELLQNRGFWLFTIFLVLLILLYYSFTAKMIESPEGMKKPIVFVGICFAGVLYFLNLISFAYSTFMFIPNFKGGGDFSEMADTTLVFRENGVNDNAIRCIPPDMFSNKSSLKSKRFKIIHETPTTVYLANVYDAHGPKSWRKGMLPTVYGIRRENISSMITTWDTPKFTLEEFGGEKRLTDLCRQISKDGVEILNCDITALNNLLNVPDLATLITTKHKYQPSEIFNKLYEETSRLRKSSFVDLIAEDKDKILQFNRLLLETMYSDTCPKTSFFSSIGLQVATSSGDSRKSR